MKIKYTFNVVPDSEINFNFSNQKLSIVKASARLLYLSKSDVSDS